MKKSLFGQTANLAIFLSIASVMGGQSAEAKVVNVPCPHSKDIKKHTLSKEEDLYIGRSSYPKDPERIIIFRGVRATTGKDIQFLDAPTDSGKRNRKLTCEYMIKHGPPLILASNDAGFYKDCEMDSYYVGFDCEDHTTD